MRPAEDRLRKERNGVTFPSASLRYLPLTGALAFVRFPLSRHRVSPGTADSLLLGFSGINFQQLPFSDLAHPQVRPFGSHWINMAWVPSHCLLYKMVGRKDFYGFGKLHQELSCACAYWESPLPKISFFSLNIYVHFNTFWFQEECASIICSATLIFVRHLFCHLSNPTNLCSGSGGQLHWGP